MTRAEFTANVNATQEALRRFLTALCCGDSSLADDLAQEAYLKAYLSAEPVREFRPWIFRVALNAFLSHRRVLRPLEPEERAAAVAAPAAADYSELYRALGQLSEKERVSVTLHYLEGYAIREIAGMTGTTADAVKQHLLRGRQHLRRLLKQ